MIFTKFPAQERPTACFGPPQAKYTENGQSLHLDLSVRSCRSDRRRSPPADDVYQNRDDEEDKKDKEKNLSETRGGRRDPTKSEKRRDERDNEK